MNTKMVLVGYPLEGNLKLRFNEIMKICVNIQRAKYTPVAPQIFAITDSRNDEENVRKVVSEATQMCLSDGSVTELWLYGSQMTRDMIASVRLAHRHNITVEPKSDMTRRIFGHRD